MSQITDNQLRSACQDRCGEFGEPACYELAHDEGAKFEPCIPCLIDCGLPIPPEPLDPNAVVAPLL